MPDGLFWVPSLVVFGGAAIALVAGVVGFRRLGVRREAKDVDAARALETSAKARLVRADEAVRDAEQEVRFAEAQFGAQASREFASTVDRARGWLREAFLLQQRLDDAEPHTAAERRSWSWRIASLCDSVERLLAEAGSGLAGRRAAERGAAADAPALRERAERLARRRADGAAALDRLGTRFSAAALAGAHGALNRAGRDLDRVDSALDEAASRLDGGAGLPVADLLERATHALDRAEGELTAVERVELDLAQATTDAAAEAAALDSDLVAARRERDAATDPDAASALSVAIGDVSPLLVGREDRAGDPFAERDRLRAARDRLEVARSGTRRAEQRLDGARGALPGAIAIAESQIAVAHSAMERARAFAGADARTRLAEAERQLGIARREADPVAALDAARRAAARASDAEALAHYAALHR
ncbi:putative nucleic acid-binding Zn-ribbon protein [Agromyces flavus]|uniref:Nucleic acid-binding Zn-ribbon protein n=1 Tax=Agromyces flavus TaxID=589382 RepID=A0A1H1LIF2_9MICO|nr:hypothetical protein [Agromyces flavus]MCP2368525.1 putative nucleic acid-binding Zn-ribbon protein [Agromyces flavus]GGI48234.1 hypothetical protein GCM10010932_29220 [Agromyces flavus]SDR74308.1 hypothetical protein SAMN04489721_0154 [Agromyces flavus]